jgi:iron(III) transport system substrate-binding protein
MVTVTIFLRRLAALLFLALAPALGAAQSESLTLYTSNAAPTIEALRADFEKHHGVRVDVWRASSVKVLQRLLAEKQAGRWEFDVVSISAPELEALYREGLLQEVTSSAHARMREGLVPAHRGWAPQFINVFVQAYNTSAIRAEALPRRWDELAEPRWKGMLGVEANAGEWYCALLGALGERQGAELFQRIVANNGVSVRQGNSVLANLVVSGEVPLALAVYSHMIDEARERGAPVASFTLEPLVARANGIALSKKPPHPRAARLFYEYNLGDAQPLLVNLHYVSPLKDMPSPLAGKFVLADAAMDRAAAARCESAYQALIKKGTP